MVDNLKKILKNNEIEFFFKQIDF